MSTAHEAARKICLRHLGHSAEGIIEEMVEIIETEYKHVEDHFTQLEVSHNVALLKKDEAIEDIQVFTRDLIKAAEGYIYSHQHPVASFTHRIDMDKIDLLNAITEAKRRS